MLRSVTRQTYQNWELVLVDASDPDKRLERRLPKAVPGTIVYEPVENGGIAANTTRGFEMAHGDYIALLDHDDVLYLNALSRLCRPSKTRVRTLSIVTRSYSRRI